MSDDDLVDLVDAIAEWSERCDDELSEDDVDAVLRIMLAIDGTDWSGVDIDTLTARDVSTIKAELHDVDAPEFTSWVVDSALGITDEPFDADEDEAAADEDDADEDAADADADADAADDDADADEDAADDDADADAADEDDEDADAADTDDEDADAADTDDEDADAADEDEDADAADEDAADDDDADAADTDDATVVLDRAVTAAIEEPTITLDRSIPTPSAPVPLRDGPDVLGPSFLEPAARSNVRRLATTGLALAALIAFVLAGLQLARNVGDNADADVSTSDGAAEPTEAAATPVEVEPAATPTPESSDDTAAAAPAGDDDEAAAPAPTPTPAPITSAVIRTASGAVVSVKVDGADRSPTELWSPEGDTTAAHITNVTDGIAIVTDGGDVDVVDFAAPGEARRVWSADDLGTAVDIVQAGERYVVVDESGSVNLFDSSSEATSDSVTIAWDTSTGLIAARSLTVYQDLVPFVMNSGDVQMVVTSTEGDPIAGIWSAESQPAAFNAAMYESGLLLGVGEGAVARYRWFDNEAPLQAIWDPFADDRKPAIGYAGFGEETAIVVDNGSVLLVDENGDGPMIWDADLTDLRAIRVVTMDDTMVLLLESGTVLQVDPAAETIALGSIWDVTDETLSPATELLLATW